MLFSLFNCIDKYYNKLYCFGNSIYTVFLKNIMMYYEPLEEKYVFNKNNKIKYYNRLKTYNSKNTFIYKLNKVERKKCQLYNYGYYYHTSDLDRSRFNNIDIAYSPDTIQSMRLSLGANDEKSYQIIINDIMNKHKKFISSILSFSTSDSRLSILLYFYLQKYLNIFDKIISVEVEINGKFYDIDVNDTLRNIYSSLETKLDEIEQY